MPETTSPKRLNKELGFLSVFALAAGTTLSAGFFLLPGIAVKEAGSAVVLAYLVAALPMIPATCSIVELVTAMPRAGGAYYFLDRSLGPMVGTIGGLGTWLALILKTSFALIGMGAYIGLFFEQVPIKSVAVLFALMFGAINLYGAKGAGRFQIFLVTGLLVLLSWFLTGVFNVQWTRFDDFFQTSGESVLATAGLVYISYVGVTNVASVSEEVRDPEKILPRAVFLAMFTSVVIYAIGATVMVGVLGVDRMSDENNPMFYAPVAAAAAELFGWPGKLIITTAAVLAFFSVANAGILSASRYPLAMSRDQLIPGRFQKLNANGIPTLGIVLTVSVIIAVLLLLNPEKIAKLASAFQLLIFAMLCLSVIAMRESHIHSYDPSFRSPLYPWMQLAGVILPLILISQMDLLSIVFSSGLVVAGVVWFLRYGKNRVERDGAIYHVFHRLGQRKYNELDDELRDIMAEKGLRAEDPFDDIVARSSVIDLSYDADFEAAAQQAAAALSQNTPDSADHIREGFQRGTHLGTVAISKGVALPHLRVPDLPHPQMVLVRCGHGLSIDHLDDFGEQHEPESPVRALFFLVSPEENPARHLRILAHLATQLDDDNFMVEWLRAKNDQELKEVLLRNERYVSFVLRRDKGTADFIDKRIVELHMAPGCLIAIVHRDESTFVPKATTRLHEGDRITVIGEPPEITALYDRYHA